MEPRDVLSAEYEIERRFVGGMGQLFVARERKTDELCAVKTLRADLVTDEHVRRFRVEARAWMALGKHPNVVEAKSFRELGGWPFLVLEYVEAANLEDLLEASGALPLAQALDLGRQIVAGLQHAHVTRVRDGVTGLVHRDLKPANLLVRKADRRLQITDWGLVKILGATRLTADQQMLGTLKYCAPEQVLSAADVDARADLYAVGVILYEMISGVHPIPGESMREVLHDLFEATPLPLRERMPRCPPDLADLVDALLAKDPDARPATAAEVAAVLAKVPEVEEPSTTCSRCGFVRRPAVARCPLCSPAVAPGSAPGSGAGRRPGPRPSSGRNERAT